MGGFTAGHHLISYGALGGIILLCPAGAILKQVALLLARLTQSRLILVTHPTLILVIRRFHIGALHGVSVYVATVRSSLIFQAMVLTLLGLPVGHILIWTRMASPSIWDGLGLARMKLSWYSTATATAP